MERKGPLDASRPPILRLHQTPREATSRGSYLEWKVNNYTRWVLEEASDGIEAASGIQPTFHVCNGQPSTEIVRLGDELGTGLTLVGSRGREGIKRALLGSVSTSVARHAFDSVLVFRPDGTQAAD